MKKAAWLVLGVVAMMACKAEVVTSDSPSPGPTTTAEAGTTPEGGSEPEVDAGPLVCPPNLQGFDPLVGQPGAARKAACTDAEIDALVRGCLESSDRFEDAACTGTATACSQCMLSKEKDPTWGPVVMLGDASMHGFVVNQAGCIETTTGVARGRAIWCAPCNHQTGVHGPNRTKSRWSSCST